MGFSDKQMRALARSVPARAIRSRLRAGRELSYIEGWYVISQANRIFGFEGWDRETIETKCVMAREARGSLTAIYSARVKITVRTGDTVIVRDGHGSGEAHGTSAGEVHDRALKAAETDATKRALATFGKAFGLELYAGRPCTRPASQVALGEARTDASPRPVSVGHGANGSDNSTEETRPAEPERFTRRDSGTSDATSVREIREPVNVDRPSDSDRQKAIATVPTNKIENGVAASPVAGSTPNGGRIDKAALTFPEPHRIRDKDHLRFVASQPCLLCSTTPSDAHHVRFAQPRAMSRKVSDDFTVPLCRKHHRDLHHCGNEAAFWHDMGIDPLQIAKKLWEETEGRTRSRKPDRHVSL